MSADHRRPLFAFVMVFLIGMLVVANAARSEAFRDLVRQHTAAVVAGALLDLTDAGSPAVVAEPELVMPAADPQPASDRASAKRHHRAGAAAHAPRAKAHGERAGGQQARGHGHQTGKQHGVRAHGPVKAQGPKAHGPKAHGAANSKAKAKGHVAGKAKGHSQGKGHQKSKGKGHQKHGH